MVNFILIMTGEKQVTSLLKNVKLLVDYLTKLWCSDYNVSHKNEITIGFYGGEPLLNMKLVKETIAYIESLNLPSLILITIQPRMLCYWTGIWTIWWKRILVF